MDILKSYQLQANCYLNKPVQLEAFEAIVKSVNYFWANDCKIAAAGEWRVSRKVVRRFEE